MKRLAVATWAITILTACQASSSASSPVTEPEAALGQLCDAASSSGLEGIATQLDVLVNTNDKSEIEAASATARANLELLELEGDQAEWRVASVDALNQLERRIDEPERLPEVARHAARTLRGLEGRICS
ncbi:MAG: hypothetical protein WD651_11715 [Acidimicrobiia bacterium]